MTQRNNRPVPFVTATAKGGAILAGAAIVLLVVVMLAEAMLRYVFSYPLGWNVSAVERLLMPAAVFFSLPWLYVHGGHVTADLVYERLAPSVRRFARVLTVVLIVVAAALLVIAGGREAWESFRLGDVPPPGSSDVAVPTWVWQGIQPLGALALLAVVLVDAGRFIRDEEVTP
ncbi:TRAP transporter small permease [Sediminivirga luteola]|uniref:Tripartite ATP-independent periplasmic transporters DctQ component domain-containing protein n=1 Tax=Sediminivirga luteola TaxID=1774748 RepID=A0A8J2TVJ9_9MICO|nr:TRAP transporter small permease [Sediminivirga luteola]MCI2265893.1 TRAP transporter small permease [Sediminivirga luteola]GGA03994.1 hypothetical protein GCM10011333_03480 [Sediminivirga luteola]